MTPELAKFRQREWSTAKGIHKQIFELETSHVLNILNWVKTYPHQYEDKTYELFEEEVAHRMIFEFIKGAPTPYKDADGRWGFIDPVADRKRKAKETATIKYFDKIDKKLTRKETK